MKNMRQEDKSQRENESMKSLRQGDNNQRENEFQSRTCDKRTKVNLKMNR